MPSTKLPSVGGGFDNLIIQIMTCTLKGDDKYPLGNEHLRFGLRSLFKEKSGVIMPVTIRSFLVAKI